ncbi:MAG: M23 family metallopeptidase [Neisseriaceae bacterium]|nr:M23 family metallopeptidase [Neisseriaceae bacterium]
MQRGITMSPLFSRSLLLLSSFVLTACATQTPAPVVDGSFNTQTTPTIPDTTIVNNPVNNVDNPYGATPYTPETSSETVSSSGYTTPTTTTPTKPYIGNYSPVDVNATYHQVVYGDTVYNISKRYGISQDNLRAWNQIPDNNNINIGQKLRVKPLNSVSNQSYVAPAPTLSTSGAQTHQVVAGDTVYNISKRYGISQNQLRENNQLYNDDIKTGQILYVGNNSAASTSVAQNIATTPQNTNIANTTASQPVSTTTSGQTVFKQDGVVWQSPLAGAKVIEPFATSKKNIKLSGKVGQNIVAPADGQVILVGASPRGYSGDMLIIQHNSGYVSACTNIQNITVKELQNVKRGQKLGSLNNSGSMLFEMRSGSNKNPIDPNKVITTF